ncbi:hypothetical protein ABC345_02885 [Shouchella sp. 1P09AA]|uniref:hypothetical protein n=1 Tax=unclassified Shouchella TaxID=2893065 RepID=UPI0039A25EED
MVVKQRGPTCGIYALLNGLKEYYSIENFTNSKIHKLSYQLLSENQYEFNESTTSGLTYIGEFFYLDKYMAFINENKKIISNFLYKECNLNVNFEVTKITFADILKTDSALFIVSILPLEEEEEKMKNDNYISHWVSFISTHNKAEFRILDSRKGVSSLIDFQMLKEAHCKLKNNWFYWDKFERKKLFCFRKIEKLINKNLKLKKHYLDKGLLINEIKHSVGEVIMIQDASIQH